LGLGDNQSRYEPQIINALQSKKVTSLACGSNFCIALGAIVQSSQGGAGNSSSSVLNSSSKKSAERTSDDLDPDSSIRGKSKSPFRTGLIAINGAGSVAVGGVGSSNVRNGGVRRNQGFDSVSSNDENNSRGRNKTPLKQLTPDEIKMRQREASYDSPRRMNDKYNNIKPIKIIYFFLYLFFLYYI
jgi:hypothetical protein